MVEADVEGIGVQVLRTGYGKGFQGLEATAGDSSSLLL